MGAHALATLIPTDPNDLSKADASPTKSFFVDIITRDIQLDEAIQDLVDNCIDGAKRLRPGEDADYTGLWVTLTINEAEFRIADNCGGISLDIARKYAFKFGRAKDFAPTTRSVGQFGVGMKRALFKMGDNFSVSSVHAEHSFRIDVDVPEWVGDDRNWDFDVLDLVDGPHAADVVGTSILVDHLDPAVAETFKLELFQARLRNDLRVIHQDPMRRGLTITLNGIAIIPTAWQLKALAGNIAPAFREYDDDLGGTSLLHSRIYAGVGDSNRAAAGWYVFCNGRCILEADQTSVTGWSEVTEAGVQVPKYHGQFARFRGYAFLDSDDASLLPWNTTKTNLDFESAAYQRLKWRLIEATRPVIDFLNALDAEKDVEVADQTITKAIAQAASVALEKIAKRDVFTFIAPPPRRGPPLTTISYKKPASEVTRLSALLNASSARAVGEKSFAYAMSNLDDDGED